MGIDRVSTESTPVGVTRLFSAPPTSLSPFPSLFAAPRDIACDAMTLKSLVVEVNLKQLGV